MVVPNGWKIERLKSIFDMFAGGDLNKECFSSFKTRLHQYPIFSNSLVNNGLYGYTSKPRFNANSVTITGRGSVGHAVYRDEDFDAIIRLLVLTPKSGEQIDSRYITEYINYCVTFPLESTGVPQLTVPQVQEVTVLLPSFTEQTAIAEALSDADSLIASLEKLIAKKKAIKQGTMQELLTGKKRLPGFIGEWAIKPLLECCDLLQGLTYSPDNVQSFGLLVLRSSNIQGGQLSFNDCVFVNCTVDESKYVQPNDILICVRNGSSALIGKSCVIDKTYNATFGAFMSVLRGDSTGYIAHVFKSDIVQNQIRNRSSATINQITKRDFEDIRIPIPPTQDEQTAIASILSDMDVEIEQLEKKLAKYRLIKQGMMQELLTGRIRLIETGKNAESAPKGHNQHYDDAIAISAIVNAFYDDRFILGRVKVQKLLYLLRRKQDADVSAFKKKAAGPYNEEARYKGGESIAVKSGYIIVERNNKGSKFSKGGSIAAALKYVGNMQSDIDWLLEKFRFYNTNKETKNLEVLATVDMAACELEKNGKAISLDAVKDVIRYNKEWTPKLQKPYFTDAAINQAILESKELFS